MVGTREVRALVSGRYSVTVADRTRSSESEVAHARLDLTEDGSVDAIIAGHDLVVNRAYPHHRRYARADLPYVDICDAPAAAESIRAMDRIAERAGVAALTGAGLSPGVAAGFAMLIPEAFESIETTDIVSAQRARRSQQSLPGIRVEVRGSSNGVQGSALISMANDDRLDDAWATPLVAAVDQLASGALPAGVRGPITGHPTVVR